MQGSREKQVRAPSGLLEVGGERRRGGKGGCTVHVVMNSRSLDYYEPLDEGGGVYVTGVHCFRRGRREKRGRGNETAVFCLGRWRRKEGGGRWKRSVLFRR